MALLDRLSSGWKAYLILFAITFTAAAPGVFNLPALDRDESRFAQASKQYLETGDYLIIRYQDEYRNKKPAGIHWLQSGSTALLGDEDRLEIWTYRVPSWLGAALAAMACFWCGLVLIGRRAAFLGSALFAATLLLTSEAHISKTDGVLVFLTTLAIGAMARLYMGETAKPKRMALVFWTTMGAALLIKGPVTPMVAAYAGMGAWVWNRASGHPDNQWWKPLAWWPGPAIALAMFLPWLVAIQIATSGEFIQGAVGKDLKDKFAGASEGHAGWPLYHITHIPAWFFPATLLTVPAIAVTWKALRGSTETARRRATDAILVALALGALTALATWVLPGELGNGAPSAFPAILIFGFWFLSRCESWLSRWVGETAPLTAEVRALRFLAAWSVLTLLFFELMPTRLSHYILPAYPAFALLCGWAAVKLYEGAKMPISRWVSLGLYVLGGGALMLISSPFAVREVQSEAASDFKTVDGADVLNAWTQYAGFPMWLWWLGGAALAMSALVFVMRKVSLSILLGVVASMLLGWHARTAFLPTQTWVQPTESAILALKQVCGLPSEVCVDGVTSPARVLAVGYAEPSYVMTTGTQNLHPPETPIGLPNDSQAYPVVYLLNMEDKAAEPVLAQLLEEANLQGRCISQSDPVYALNYSNGDPVHFKALRFEASACKRATE